jgi:hypothetical protein
MSTKTKKKTPKKTIEDVVVSGCSFCPLHDEGHRICRHPAMVLKSRDSDTSSYSFSRPEWCPGGLVQISFV